MPYPLVVDYSATWAVARRGSLDSAVQYWASIITAPSAPVMIDGRRVDGLAIAASIIDGAPGGEFAQSGPVALRPPEAGASAYRPATAILRVDSADYTMLEQDGRLASVLLHEIGHALGFGIIWSQKNCIAGKGTANPTFVGARAMAEYGALRGGGPMPVEVENRGGADAANKHWRETIFGNEIMSSYVDTGQNRLSRVTIAAMEDVGYAVDYSKAQPFALPNHNFSETIQLLPPFEMQRPRTRTLPKDALIAE